EWQIIDYAGNTTNYTQTIRITDNTNPTFTTPATVYENAESDNDTSITLPKLVVDDNVGVEYLQYKKSTDSVWLDWPNGVNGDANKTIGGYVLDSANLSSSNPYEDFYIEWQIIDYGGNTTNYTQTIRITDDIPPELNVENNYYELNNSNPQEMSVNAEIHTPSVSDNVSDTSSIVLECLVLDETNTVTQQWHTVNASSLTSVIVSYPDSGIVGGGNIVYTIQWRATDEAGNTSVSDIYTTISVNFILDNYAPIPLTDQGSGINSFFNFHITNSSHNYFDTAIQVPLYKDKIFDSDPDESAFFVHPELNYSISATGYGASVQRLSGNDWTNVDGQTFSVAAAVDEAGNPYFIRNTDVFRFNVPTLEPGENYTSFVITWTVPSGIYGPLQNTNFIQDIRINDGAPPIISNLPSNANHATITETGVYTLEVSKPTVTDIYPKTGGTPDAHYSDLSIVIDSIILPDVAGDATIVVSPGIDEPAPIGDNKYIITLNLPSTTLGTASASECCIKLKWNATDHQNNISSNSELRIFCFPYSIN
ncbi:MAG: hypothetical protein CML47_01340, partial [Rhodobacteraceae bacterium]